MVCNFFYESLILAQNERWQRGLGMQVERDPEDLIISVRLTSGESGERASNARAIYLLVWDNLAKARLIPDVVPMGIHWAPKAGLLRDPSLIEGPVCHQLVGVVTAHQGIRLAGLRERPAALGLRHCPDSYGRLQSRIIRNGRKPDDATLRGG